MLGTIIGEPRMTDELKSITRVTVWVDVLSSEAAKVVGELGAAAFEISTRTVEPF